MITASCPIDSSDLIAVGRSDGLVQLLRRDDGTVVTTIEAHAGRVSSLAVSDDDRKLLSSSFDGTIAEWDMGTGQLLTRTGQFGAWVRDAAYDSPRDRILCVGSKLGVFAATRQARFQASYGVDSAGHLLQTMSISGDGTSICAAGFSNRIRAWSLEKKSNAKQLIGHLAAVTDVEFTQDGSQIVSASMDHSVRIWNADLGKETSRLLGHQGPVRCLSLSPDGAQLLSGGVDGTIRLWSMPRSGN